MSNWNLWVQDGIRRRLVRNPMRIPNILFKLGQAWKIDPEMRLGQLLLNIACLYDKERYNDYTGLWMMDDDAMDKALTHYIRTMSRDDEGRAEAQQQPGAR